MPENYKSHAYIHQALLILILLGLIIGTALPARGSEIDEPWSLRDIVRSLEPSVVWIFATESGGGISQGSGFVIHEDGYILTNAHVVEQALQVTVGWTDRFTRSEQVAEIIMIDSDLDLAVLHIDATHLSAIPIDTTEDACLGDAVVALGYPAGSELGLGDLTVTRGVLSSLRCGSDGEVGLIQTDAAVTLGCSGGPLYDVDTGNVIGIVQGMGMLILDGFNFAIPSKKIFELSGTDPDSGISGVIELMEVQSQDFSHPTDRLAGIYASAVDARNEFEWGEALSNFRFVTQLEGEDSFAAYGVAESYAALDQPRPSLRWLERAFERGYSDFNGALEADGFSAYEDDFRFIDLVESF